MKKRKEKRKGSYKELYVELEIIGRGNSGKIYRVF